MSALLLRGGRVVDPANGVDALKDVLLRDGKVADLGDGQGAAAQVIDATGAVVVPGLVDLRAWLKDGRDVAAAQAGGFSTVVASPESASVVPGLLRVIRAPSLTRGLAGEELGEVPVDAPCLSNGFKPIVKGGVLKRALEFSKPLGPLLMVHAEDPTIVGRGLVGEGVTATRMGLFGVSPSAEVSVVARDLAILEVTGGRLHFSHLTCARSFELVRDGKRRGLKVSCDVTPHHLTLDDRTAEGYAMSARVWPPLRSQGDVAAARAALADGTAEVVATDHCRAEVLEREHAFEECLPGRESLATAFATVARTGVALARVVAAMSCGPARLLSLDLGHLSVGARADVALFDDASFATRLVITGGRVVWSRAQEVTV